MHRIKYWIYHWLYAPLASAWENLKHEDDPPVPAVPCQLCGQPGHHERYCPKAHELGFLDDSREKP
jgi:hypothetical protein